MRLIPIVLLFILGACSHPLQIVGQGDIVSASGTRDCLYDTYSVHADPTTEPCPNTVVAAYEEVYSAVPKPGWTFAGWGGCPTDTADCSFTIPASTVGQYWGSQVGPLVANFAPGLLFERIAHRVVDAHFVRHSDTLVTLGDDSTLYVYDTATRETQSLQLQGSGFALSVSPDGTKAVVGHKGFISYVDLAAMQVERLYSITTDVFDIVLPGNGYIYVAPGEYGDITYLRAISLQTGEETESTGRYSRGGANTLSLHPSQEFIYGSQNFGRSSYIKYDIRGSIVIGDERPVRSNIFTWPNCGKMWPTDDGLRMITGCGYRNWASNDDLVDMAANGWLRFPQPVRSIQHLSQYESEILLIEDEAPNVIARNNYPSLVVTEAETLPLLNIGEQSFPLYGRYIFHKSDGSYLVIVQADEASGLSRDFGIVHRLPLPNSVNVRPYAIAPVQPYANIGDSVTLDGTDSFDAEGLELTYLWSLVEAPPQSSAYVELPNNASTTFTPDRVGAYKLEFVVSDGERSSYPRELTVVVEDPADSEVVDLDYSVIDAAYSSSLNHLVMLAQSPDRIVQYDLGSGETSEILLPAAGDHIDVAPSGTVAAVTHGTAKQVSILDLEEGVIDRIYNTPRPVGDVVLSNNDYAYTFFPLNASSPPGIANGLLTINLLTDVVSEGVGLANAGVLAKLHPAGNFLYGVERSSSPADILSYDIRSGEAFEFSELPYHGEFVLCGNLWISLDGASIYTACGNIFTAIPEDMHYEGHLEVAGVIASLAQNQETIALVLEEPHRSGEIDESTRVDVFDAVTRSHLRRIELPLIEIEGIEYSTHGRFVFYSASGDTLAVIVQADAESGVVNNSLVLKR